MHDGSVRLNAKDSSVMDESVEIYNLNILIGIRLSLIIKKRQRNGYTNYNVNRLEVL